MTYTTPQTSTGASCSIDMTETASNATLNKSTFAGTMYLDIDIGFTGGLVKGFIYNGSTLLFSASKVCTAGGTPQSEAFSFDLPHNANGAGTLNLNLVCIYDGAQTNLTQAVSMTSIERRSSISLSGNKNLGATESKAVTDKFSTAKCKLFVKTGSSPNVEIAPLTTGNLAIEYKKVLAQYMSAMTQTATAYLYTYDGNSLVGYRTYTISLVIPSGAYTLAGTIDSLAPSLYGAYVQSKSGIVVNASASLSGAYSDYYTTIKKIAIHIDTMDGNINGSSGTWTSGVFSGSGTMAVTITAYDNHGKTATATQNISVASYTAPAISSFSAVRNGANNVDYTFTLNKSLDWEFSGVSTLSGTNTGVVSGSFALADSTSGTLTLTATDDYGGSVATALVIPTAGAYIARAKVNGNKSVCIGDFVSHEGFDVAMPIYCRNDGIKGFGDVPVEVGTASGWDFVKYASGKLILTGTFTMSVQSVSTWGTYFSAGKLGSVNFPSGLIKAGTFPIVFPAMTYNASVHNGGIIIGEASSYNTKIPSANNTGDLTAMRPSGSPNSVGQNYLVNIYVEAVWK